ncbi:MAG TPA: hypothetical protein VHA13_00650 [Gammaproteobacteria bacterium]|nr:hypothetical protein [Gammaproteobacteria bacterium]
MAKDLETILSKTEAAVAAAESYIHSMVKGSGDLGKKVAEILQASPKDAARIAGQAAMTRGLCAPASQFFKRGLDKSLGNVYSQNQSLKNAPLINQESMNTAADDLSSVAKAWKPNQ